MRIWKILASIATLAIGLTLWQYGRWEGEECCGGDGTAQALAELLIDALSVPFFVASLIILLWGDRILKTLSKMSARSDATMQPDLQGTAGRGDS
jgi:hypothetical protein